MHSEKAQRGKLRNREKQLIRLVYIALKNNNPHENDKALISQVAYKKNPQNGKRHNIVYRARDCRGGQAMHMAFMHQAAPSERTNEWNKQRSQRQARQCA